MTLRKHPIVLLFVLLACVSGGCRSARAGTATVAATSDTAIALLGTVRWEKRSGPPDFGTSPNADSNLAAWVLRLDAPIDVGGSTIDAVHLTLPADAPDEETLEGLLVVAEGQLRRAPAGPIEPWVLSATRVLALDERASICPPVLQTTQTAEAPAGWNAHLSGAPSTLSGAGLCGDDPAIDRGRPHAILKYSSHVDGPRVATYTWTLGEADTWIWCSYHSTRISVSRKLPRHSSCTVVDRRGGGGVIVICR